MNTPTQAAIDYAQALTAKFSGDEQYEYGAIFYGVLPGKKFDKLVHGSAPYNLSTVAGFIDRETGDLYKAAGWSKPAPKVRYSGDELLTRALDDADLYGAYLYL